MYNSKTGVLRKYYFGFDSNAVNNLTIIKGKVKVTLLQARGIPEGG
jgi:hypothetical protein